MQDHPHHHHDDYGHHAHGHHHHHHAPHGHNGGPVDHLHSHLHGHAGAEELKVLTSAFVDGFRAAADKTSYLRLAGIPFQRRGTDGLTQHLVDASIVGNWQIGTASPAFGTRELAYLPFPGSMVTSRETMTLTYVSLTERADLDVVQILAARSSTEEDVGRAT
jgi:hypothetical protein